MSPLFEYPRRNFIRSQVAGGCICSTTERAEYGSCCGACQKWEEYCCEESCRREALEIVPCYGGEACACLACTDKRDAAEWDALAEELRAKDDAKNE